MAFNPFRAFRKHQKAWFAALTIMAMISFVLLGSVSAVADLLPRFGRSGQPEIATLYGNTLTDLDIRHLQRQREIAEFFIVQALVSANENASQQVGKGLADSKLEKSLQSEISSILTNRMQFLNSGAQLRQYYVQNLAPQYAAELDQIHTRLVSSQKAADAEPVALLADVLRMDAWIFQRQRGELYFGGSSNAKDLLDFMIWKHEADRLGIKLDSADVDRLVNRETRKRLTEENYKNIFRGIASQYRDLTRDSLRTALADEFRVRMAREAVLGPDDRVSQRPEPLTPYELWEYYREQRTESQLSLLPIPVDRPEFIKKVGQPTEKDLIQLFDEAKEREYAPDSPTAGFKQPARVTVQWVRARSDMPYFRKATEVAAAAAEASLPVAFQLSLLDEYETVKYRFPSPSWTSSRFIIHDNNLAGPVTLAATVGQAFASAGTPGSVASIAGMTANTAIVREMVDRAVVGSDILLAGASGNPFGVLGRVFYGTPSSEFLPLDAIKADVIERLKLDLAQTLVSDSLKTLEDDLNTLAKEKPEEERKHRTFNRADTLAAAVGGTLAGLGSGGSVFTALATVGNAAVVHEVADVVKSAAAAWMAGASKSPFQALFLAAQSTTLPLDRVRARVTEAIKQFGLEQGSTIQPRDRYTLGEDLGLHPLLEAYPSWQQQEEGKGGTREDRFALELFNKIGQAVPYAPQRLIGTSEFLYWKTADQPAYVPTFAEAKEKVKKRWVFEKARKFALEEARRVAIEARKNRGDVLPVLEQAASTTTKVIYLEHVAPLARKLTAVPSRFSRPEMYEPYQVPVGKIQYPSSDMVKKLLALRERGEVVVVQDRPEATYYVTALLTRTPPFELNFYHDISKPDLPLIDPGNSASSDSLFQQQPTPMTLSGWLEKETRSREKYRDSCIQQLRAQARLEVNEENLKKLMGRGGQEEE